MNPAPAHQSELNVLRARPGWTEATARLCAVWSAGRETAQRLAGEHSRKYQGRRGSMIVDVVASRQRKYETRVGQIVEAWERATMDCSVSFLADNPPHDRELGLRTGEADTMVAVAQGLRRYAAEHGLDDEDHACRAWADSMVGLEHAYVIDPYVGAVKGIGLALFAYLRMRCGADALKPDLRVRQALNVFGYNVPADPHAILTIARAVANELGTNLLVLDQLLWTNTRARSAVQSN